MQRQLNLVCPRRAPNRPATAPTGPRPAPWICGMLLKKIVYIMHVLEELEGSGVTFLIVIMFNVILVNSATTFIYPFLITVMLKSHAKYRFQVTIQRQANSACPRTAPLRKRWTW